VFSGAGEGGLALGRHAVVVGDGVLQQDLSGEMALEDLPGSAGLFDGGSGVAADLLAPQEICRAR